MGDETVRTASGRALDELTMEALLSGELSTEDLRISGETLRSEDREVDVIVRVGIATGDEQSETLPDRKSVV